MKHRFFHFSQSLILSILLLCGNVSPVLYAQSSDTDDARATWMEGYEAMNEADEFMKNDASLLALRKYESALEIFTNVNRQYPTWNTALLKYRIDYCKKRIAEIKKTNANNIEFYSKEELVKQNNKLSEELQTNKALAAALQHELKLSKNALEKARAEAAAQASNEENLRILKGDRDTLLLQLQRLTAQMNSLKEDLAAAQKQNTQSLQIPQLQTQLAATSANLANANRELERAAKLRNDLQEQLTREQNAAAKQLQMIAELKSETGKSLREAARLDGVIKGLQNEMLRLRGENQKLVKNSTDLETKHQNEMQQLRNENQKLSKVNTELKSGLQSEVSRLQGENQKLSQANTVIESGMQNELERLRSENQKLLRINTELETSSRNALGSADVIRKDLATAKSQLRIREEQLSSLRIEILAANNKLRLAEKNVVRLENELDVANKRAESSSTTMTEQLSLGRQQLQQLEKLKKDLDVSRETIAQQKKLLTNLEQAVNTAEKNALSSQKELVQVRERLQRDLSDTTQRLRLLQEQFDKFSDMANTQAKIAAEKNQKGEQDLATQTKLIEALRNSISEERKAADESRRKADETLRQAQQLQEQFDQLNQQIKDVEKARRAAEQKMQEANSFKAASDAERLSLERKLQDAIHFGATGEAERQKALAAQKAAQESFDKATEANARLKGELEQARMEQSTAEKIVKQLQQENQNGLTKIIELETRLTKTEENHKLAMEKLKAEYKLAADKSEEAHRSETNKLKTEYRLAADKSEEAHRSATDKLKTEYIAAADKKANDNNATIALMEKRLQEAYAQRNDARQNFEKARATALNIENALKDLCIKYNILLVEEVVSQPNSSSKGQNVSNNGIPPMDVATRIELTLKNLSNKIKSTETELDETTKKLNLEQNKKQAAEIKLVELTRQHGVLKEDLATGQEEIKRLTDELAKMQKIGAASTNDLSKLQKELSQAEQALSEARKEVAKSNAKITSLANEKNELNRQLEHQKALSAAAAGISKVATETTQRLEAMTAERNAAVDQRVLATQKVAQLEKKLQDYQHQIQNMLAQKKDDTASQVWAKRVAEIEAQLQLALKKQSDLEVALIKRDSEKKRLEEELRTSESRAVAAAQSRADDKTKTPLAATRTTAVNQTALSRADEIIVKGYLRQGVESERSGKTQVAQWNYEQALKLQPGNFLALKRLGLIANHEGNDSQAANYLNRAYRINPDDLEILQALGFTMMQLNQPKWAMAALSRAIALAPENAQSARLFATALGSMNWREAAMAEFNRALQLAPKDSESALNLALLSLTRSSELVRQSQEDIKYRDAYLRLAFYVRAQGLKWYQSAIQNGAQPDPSLENALKEQ